VSPTVAPRSLGPSLREERGFDLVGAAGTRSATLRAGRRSGDRRTAVRAVLQKMFHILAKEAKKFGVSLLACTPKLAGKILAGESFGVRSFNAEKTILPLGPFASDTERGG
jgi:hypothetical protein